MGKSRRGVIERDAAPSEHKVLDQSSEEDVKVTDLWADASASFLSASSLLLSSSSPYRRRPLSSLLSASLCSSSSS